MLYCGSQSVCHLIIDYNHLDSNVKQVLVILLYLNINLISIVLVSYYKLKCFVEKEKKLSIIDVIHII